jgi:phage terminase large subunit
MTDPRGKHPNSLKNLRQGPPFPKGHEYNTMAALRRARIQQLCTMDVKQLSNLKGKTIYDDMIIRMLKSLHPKDHELIMKADAPGLLRDEIEIKQGTGDIQSFVIPPEKLARDFIDVYRDIVNRNNTEYIFSGGRGSTKSSFVSLAIIYLLVNNPTMHVLVMRQVADTLRGSVYSQLGWAISELGLSSDFKLTVSPLEIEYLPTGQKIFFKGADDPAKIKSIRPTFGNIGVLWFEETSEFRGDEAIRNITQSAIRGGEFAFIFKSYNPPRTASNWINKYLLVPKENQYQHKSDYRSVPAEWLGKTFLAEAEHLKTVNELAYRHEYLGEVVGSGGLVFQNLEIREITDEEIYGTKDDYGLPVGGFDRVYHGLDWGYSVDPLHYLKCSYNAGQETIYVFDEFRAHKMSNRELYERLTEEKGLTPEDDLIADSAEPKSVGDLKSFGLNCRGAEKGPESVRYSMRWLENRAKIVIDSKRCPYLAEEMLNYEFEQTKDGEYISGYPDKDNHGIDALRYALNRVYKVRGQ